MDILKICALGIAACVLIAAIKNQTPVFALILALGTGIIIMMWIVPQTAAVVEIVRELFSYADTDDKYLKLLFKIIGISYVGQFSAQICNDAGQKAVGDKIELAARVLVGVYTLPVVKNLMDMVTELLP